MIGEFNVDRNAMEEIYDAAFMNGRPGYQVR